MPEKTFPRLLMIADDLTGALDASVAFAGAGRRVAVARHPGVAALLAGTGPDVLCVNLGTRDGPEADARTRMTDLCAALDLSAFDIVFKKVDSRLKGHPGAELAVLSDAMGAPPCVAVPAIPSMGRVQRGGQIEGRGVEAPIPVAPLFEAPVEVPDAVSDAQIDAVVAARVGVIWVGARGLAQAIARRHGVVPASTPTLRAPLLMAIGSRDPITLAQVAALGAGPVHAAPDGRARALSLCGPVEVVRMTDGGAAIGSDAAGTAFAEGIAALAGAYRPAALLCSGGETANAILARLGIDTLEVRAEIAPGLPICEVAASWGMVRLITKSGGFGDPDTLARIAADCRAGLDGDDTR